MSTAPLAQLVLASQWHAASWQHLVALASWSLLTAGAVLLGRSLRGTPRAETLRRAVGCLGLLTYAVSCGYYLAPGRFTWSESIPIQLCDLAGLIAPLAIMTRRRWLRALLHFWAFALCTQFFVTPIHQPGSPTFIIGWLLHGAIIGIACFDALALRFRPDWKDLRLAVLAGLGYVGVVFLFNLATGFNYGYVGQSKPGMPTVVDALGPWPLRVVWLVMIAIVAMSLVWLFNTLLRAKRANLH